MMVNIIPGKHQYVSIVILLSMLLAFGSSHHCSYIQTPRSADVALDFDYFVFMQTIFTLSDPQVTHSLSFSGLFCPPKLSSECVFCYPCLCTYSIYSRVQRVTVPQSPKPRKDRGKPAGRGLRRPITNRGDCGGADIGFAPRATTASGECVCVNLSRVCV